jgi:hypothetical protein
VRLFSGSTSDNWGWGFAQYTDGYQVVGSFNANSRNGQIFALTKRVLFP